MEQVQRQTSDKLWTLGQILSILAGNAVPLLGVYVWGWPPVAILLIYWLETGIIGFYTTIKLLLALPSYQHEPGRRVRYRQRSDSGASRSFEVEAMPPMAIVPFFVLVYSGAMLFVMAFGFAFLGQKTDLVTLFTNMTSDWRHWLPLLGILLTEHAVAAYSDYFRGPRWTRSDPVFHLWRPAGRFLLFYFLILAGGLLLQTFGTHHLVIFFVLLKLIGELCTVPFGDARWERTPA